jgi:hypothetical protein
MCIVHNSHKLHNYADSDTQKTRRTLLYMVEYITKWEIYTLEIVAWNTLHIHRSTYVLYLKMQALTCTYIIYNIEKIYTWYKEKHACSDTYAHKLQLLHA